MKLYNSQLSVTLKLINLPFNVTEDVGKYEVLKRNLSSLNYEILVKDTNINIKPVLNVALDELSHPFFPMLMSVVNNSHSIEISINPILISEFGLDINKIIGSIENIVNTTLDIENKEKNKKDTNTIESLEGKLKKYNSLLSKYANNKVQTNKISDKIIDLNNKLEKLKKYEKKTDLPRNDVDSI